MLNKLQQFRKDKEQGFTLLELLVVILIIGILAAIAIPAFLNQRKSANDAALQSDLVNAATAIGTDGLKYYGRGALDSNLTAGVISENIEWGNGNKIHLSEGSQIRVSGTYDRYCITGWNSGSHHDEEPLNYDSVNGGLLDDGVIEGGACTTGDTTAPAPGDGGGNEELSQLGWTQADGRILYWVTHDDFEFADFTFHINTATGETRLDIHDNSRSFNDLHGQVQLGGSIFDIFYDSATNTATLDESLLDYPLYPATWSDAPQKMSITDTPAEFWQTWERPPAETDSPIVDEPTEEPQEPTEEPTEEPEVELAPLTATFGAATVNIDRATGNVTGTFTNTGMSGVRIHMDGMDKNGNWDNLGDVISLNQYDPEEGAMVRSWTTDGSLGDLSKVHEIRITGYGNY